MQRIVIVLFTLFFFYNCASQANLTKISAEEIRVLNSVKVNNFDKNQILIFSSQEEFEQFQFNLPQTHARSAPILNLDFTTKKAIAIYQDQIGSYEIEGIEVKNKKSKLVLKSIDNYQNNNSANLIILEVPNTIQQLTLKK